MKKVFNGVTRDVPIERLRHQCILEGLVGWIENFSRNQQAMVIVNGTSIEVPNLHHISLS